MEHIYHFIYDCLKQQKYKEQRKMLNEFIDSYDEDNLLTVSVSKCATNVMAVFNEYRDKQEKLPDLCELSFFEFSTPKVIEVCKE